MFKVTKESIYSRTSDFWNTKTKEDKIKLIKKYKHIEQFKNTTNDDWLKNFDELSKEQKVLLCKGELIRTYDALPNIMKTKLKRDNNLSTFSSKWFKLPKEDKVILLNTFVI